MADDARLKVILEAKDLSNKAFLSFKKNVSAVTRSVFSLKGGLASVGFALTGKEIFDSGRNMAQLEKAFTEITGTTAAMGREFDFVRDVSERMGQNFYDLIPTYKSILAASQGTNLEGQKTRDIFEGIIKAAATLGLSGEQTAGALRAIEQMMSKGKVQAEELRGQLGERLPGAFRLAAEAMGVTTAELNKMLDDGKIMADDLLPKLADVLKNKYSGEVDAATAAANSMAQSWEDLKVSMAGSGFLDSISTAMTNVSNAFKDEDFKRSMSDFAENMGVIVERLSKLMKYAGLRSIFGTMSQGAELAKEGKLDWEKFLTAGFLERQRMVDAVLKSARNAGGYADNDALEAAFNNPAVKLTPPPLPIIPDSADTAASLKAFAKEYEKYTKKISDDIKSIIDTWDAVDDALENAFGDLDAYQKDISIDLALDDFYSDLDIAQGAIKSTYDDIQGAFTGWGANFSSMLTDAVWGAELSFSRIAESFGRMITQMVIQKKVVEPIFSEIFTTINGRGNVYGADGFVPFASGGVVTRSTVFPFADGIGLMGEAGPEAIMPLTRLPSGDLGVKSAGGGTSVKYITNVYNNNGSKVEVKEVERPEGPGLDIIIEDIVTEKLTERSSRFNQTYRQMTGARMPLVRR